MVLKNSTRNRLHALDFTLSLIGVFWCIAIALWFGYGPLAFWIAFLLPLVLSLPTFWVHCEYLLMPHTKKIETNYESQKMTLTTKAGEEVISFDQSMSKNNVNTSYHFIPRYKNDVMLFFYLRGSYRRLDNTGLFTINNVYGYNISGKTTTITKGLTKQNVIAVVQKNEK